MASACRRTLWALFLLGILATGCARAADPNPAAAIRLLPFVQYAVGNLPAPVVLSGRTPFTTSPTVASSGWPANFWMRFTLRSANAKPERWLFLLPNVERVDFYVPDANGAYRTEMAGTDTAFADRAQQYAIPAIELAPSTPRDAPIYAHVVYHPEQAFAPALRTVDDYFSRIKLARLVQGLFLGAMLAVVLFNLYAFFGLRDYPAIFFVLYAAAMALNELVSTDIGAEYLWPHFHTDRRLGMLITASLGFTSFLVFARSFLQTRATVRTLDRLVVANLVVQLTMSVIQFAFPVGRTLVLPILACTFFGVVILSCAGIVRWRQGFRPARFFVVAFIPSTVGVLANLAYDAFLPRGNWFWANYGVEFGVILQAVVISFSVIDRIHTLDRERRRAQHIAATDALTGIANRLAFYDALQGSISHAAPGDTFGILFVDLDGFKPVNDRYGHRVGDELLRIIAQRLEASVRSDDLVARVGGDEFAVLLRRAPTVGLLRRIAEGARASLTEPMIIDGAFVRVGASIGIALFPENGASADALVDSADRQMYEEKQRHKNLLRATGANSPSA